LFKNVGRGMAFQVHQDDGWHEAKCVTCYWDDPAGKSAHAACGAGLKARRRLCRSSGLWACRCGLEQAQRVVLLGDGAEWIWKHIGGLLKERFGSWTGYTPWSTSGRAAACCTRRHGRNPAWVKEWKRCCGTGRCGRSCPAAWRSGAHASPGKRAALQALAHLRREPGRAPGLRPLPGRGSGHRLGPGRIRLQPRGRPADEARQHAVGQRRARKRAVAAGRLAHSQWDRLWATHPLAPRP